MPPHQTDPSYGYTAHLRGVSFHEARARIVDALKNKGFGVLTEIDVKSTLKAKLDPEAMFELVTRQDVQPVAHEEIHGCDGHWSKSRPQHEAHRRTHTRLIASRNPCRSKGAVVPHTGLIVAATIGLVVIHFAHVHDEAIDPKHDDAAGEAWLHGRFSYMLYRRPPESRYAVTSPSR